MGTSTLSISPETFLGKSFCAWDDRTSHGIRYRRSHRNMMMWNLDRCSIHLSIFLRLPKRMKKVTKKEEREKKVEDLLEVIKVKP